MSEKKIWLITGCSSGFGLSLTEHALKKGDSVVATARDISKLSILESKYGDLVKTVSLDVIDSNQIAQSLDTALDAFGRIDVVVNNAGYGLVGALEEYSDDQMHMNFNTNFWSAINLIRQCLPTLRNQKSGHIINISATATIFNEVGFSIYGAAKAALEIASESLCWELKPLGVKVTNVIPGPFRTDFINRSLKRADYHIEDYDQTSGKFIKFLENIDGKQPGDPDKAAKAIIEIVNSANPPLYLYLGGYAYKAVNRKLNTMKNDIDQWEDIGLHTDFK
ncbi:MAG: oxidoreductase [Thermodesulfobacteriota bacterium]